MADEETESGGQASRFSVEVDTAGDRPRVTVRGEVDVYTSPELKQAFESLLHGDAGAQTVVIDVSGLDFIDSTGLGVLVGALKRSRASGGDVVLTTPPPSIMKVFEITGLNSLFTIEG